MITRWLVYNGILLVAVSVVGVLFMYVLPGSTADPGVPRSITTETPVEKPGNAVRSKNNGNKPGSSLATEVPVRPTNSGDAVVRASAARDMSVGGSREIPALDDGDRGREMMLAIRHVLVASGIEADLFADLSADWTQAEIIDLIDYGTNIEAEWLRAREAGHPGFVRDLLHAWADPAPLFDGEDSERARPSPEGRSDTNVIGIQDRFATEQRTIYIDYDIPRGYRGDSVLIKWVESDYGKTWHMGRHPLSETRTPFQTAWRHEPEGWPHGHYRVEVLSPDLTPIAATDYIVTD